MISAFLAGFSRRDDLPQATRTQKQKLRPPVLDLGGYSHFPDGCECPILLLRLETNIQSVLCHRCSRVKGKRAAFPMSMVTSLSLPLRLWFLPESKWSDWEGTVPLHSGLA